MFRVGQKVVCVDTWHRNGKGSGDEIGPVTSEIYTVRAIGVGLNPFFPDSFQVRLFEITNPTRVYRHDLFGRKHFEAAFAARRFRPIVSRPTSIAVFEEILRKVNAPGRVTA